MLLPKIIHNSENGERVAKIISELANQNIFDYEYQEAIMKEDPIDGCASSHKAIIKKAKEDQLPFVCIFEDDIRFTAPGAWEQFNQVFEKFLPEDWDIFLGGIYFGQLLPVNDHVKKVERFSSTHCMVIRASMYDYILECPPGRFADDDGSYLHGEHIDAWISKKGPEKNFYVCYPLIAVQHDGYSDMVGAYVDYSFMLKSYQLFESR